MFRSFLVRGGIRAIAALRRPWITATLLIMLMLDACTLPLGSSVGQVTAGLTRCGCRRGPMEAIVVQDGDGIRLATAEEAYELPLNSTIASITCRPYAQQRGAWAITRITWDATMRVSTLQRPLTAKELQQARADFANIVEREQWSSRPDYPDLIRSGRTQIHDIVWNGYLHNAMSLALAALSALSLGWIRDRMRARHVRWAIEAGFCPDCRYDLRGEMDAGCPECGWRRDA